MGGRGSTFKERIKNINDILKELERKSLVKDTEILDLGDASTDMELNATYKNKQSLKNRNFKVCESLTEIDKDISKASINQIEQLAHKYNRIASIYLKENEVKVRSHKINKVNLRTGKSSPEYGTIACWSKNSNQICVNQRRTQDLSKLIESIQYSQSTKHFVQTDPNRQDKYVITHEFGHFIEDCIIQRRLKTKNYTENERSAEAYKITEEILKIAKSKYNATIDELRFSKLSQYAKESFYEWFAEAFTRANLSSTPNSLDKAMREYLKRENIENAKNTT